jgi:hypothetical protein
LQAWPPPSLNLLYFSWLCFKLVPLITPWHGPCRKHFPQQFIHCCVWIHCCREQLWHRPQKTPIPTISLLLRVDSLPWEPVCLWLLPTNRSTCYIAPPLRPFVLNDLQVYSHFLSEGRACDVCSWFQLSLPWLGSHSDYSATAPAAPSLKLLIPSGSLVRCLSVQVYYHHPFFWSMQAKVPRMVSAPTS